MKGSNREKLAYCWKDHPQVRWKVALATTRKLRAGLALKLSLEARGMDLYEWRDSITWAEDLAGREGGNWRCSVKFVLRHLPNVEP